MASAQALRFSCTSVAPELVCDTDAIASLCGTLERLCAKNTLIVCGPSILRGSNVIGCVRETLGARCVGPFAGVAPHAPVLTREGAMGGAELSCGAGFTDHRLGRKIVAADPGTIPRSILIDGKR